jgi:hypothetical protein
MPTLRIGVGFRGPKVDILVSMISVRLKRRGYDGPNVRSPFSVAAALLAPDHAAVAPLNRGSDRTATLS